MRFVGKENTYIKEKVSKWVKELQILCKIAYFDLHPACAQALQLDFSKSKHLQKQTSIFILSKRCAESMRQIYRRKPMAK